MTSLDERDTVLRAIVVIALAGWVLVLLGVAIGAAAMRALS